MLQTLPSIRVLHIVADPATGALLVAPIARRQAVYGYQVEFACSSGEYLEQLRRLGFPVNVVPIARRLLAGSHLVATYRLWRLMHCRHYHVVHTHTPVASFLGRLAATLARVPIVIYHMRGSWWESPDAGFLTRTGFTGVEWLAAHWLKTTHIFTINCSDARHLVTRCIASPERVTCLHCGAGGIDMQRFDPARVTKEQQRRLKDELGLKGADFVIGFIGRLVRRKGIIELVNAFREVVSRLPTAKLLVVGGVLASERDQIAIHQVKGLVSSHGLTERVIFTGFRSDVPELIATMDVLVLPSRFEPFGMAMAEAAAMARPIIATDTQGAREALVQGENGLIVPIGNVDALRDAILQLAADPDLRQRMGEAGRRMASERFDECVVFEQIQAVYARLLREKGLPVSTRHL